ncbi:MAG: potassium transporter TrkG [bacterium]
MAFKHKKNIFQERFSTYLILSSFFLAIVIGTLLLKIPYATLDGISWLDALFTATSSICVTGLIVVDTATKFTFFGKFIILLLIQAGGLGIMTFAVSLVWFLKQRVSLLDRMIIEQSFLQEETEHSLKYFLYFLFKYTFWTELIGACLYFFVLNEKNISKRFFFAFFHSISAFCNAGFSLYPDSLIRYQGNIFVNLITIALIILGGLGFLVIFELKHKLIPYFFNRKKHNKPFLSLHSWTVIQTSFILIVVGTALIYTFQALSGNRIPLLAALFQSVTCRTAGFNTIDLSTLSHNTLLIMIFLMFIGGSPGSTAGGIKTTTFAILVFIIFVGTRNFEDVTARERTIPKEIVYNAILIFIFSITWIFIGLILLVTFQTKESFLALLFEIISAFGTVGLSTGITSNLMSSSKIVIIITMFIGRLGPLTIFSSLLRRQTEIRYAEENILVG